MSYVIYRMCVWMSYFFLAVPSFADRSHFFAYSCRSCAMNRTYNIYYILYSTQFVSVFCYFNTSLCDYATPSKLFCVFVLTAPIIIKMCMRIQIIITHLILLFSRILSLWPMSRVFWISSRETRWTMCFVNVLQFSKNFLAWRRRFPLLFASINW